VKVRVFQLARELKISSEALVKIVGDLGHEVKGPMSSVEGDLIALIRERIALEKEATKRETEKKAHIREVIQRKPEAVGPGETKTPPSVDVAGKPKPAARAESPAARAKGARTEPPRKQETREVRRPPREPVPRQPAERTARPARPAVDARPGRVDRPATTRRDSRDWSAPARVHTTGGRRDRKKRKKRHVDEQAVKDQVRKTMADLSKGRQRVRRRRRTGETGEIEETNVLQVYDLATVAELASIMEVKPTEVIATCLGLGIMATMNHRLDKDAITAILYEFGYEPEFVEEVGAEILAKDDEEDREFEAVSRAPIVTVMGHVDHGKTSLLDYVRKARVIEGESGGITQHIGAYSTRVGEGRIAFLDTPGHEAFTAMRARGAQVTDIVVLVVAADDHVMPQTIEAISHAKAAGVPIVVAINKIDLANANIERVKKELSEHGVLVEEWGGKTVAVEISAKHGNNVDKLLEMILLESEMLELKAEPGRRARGVVIEARREAGRGIVSTILIQNGTLRIGDAFVCGTEFGKVRAMVDDTGRRIEEAGPSTPVEVLGWAGIPQAGDTFTVLKSEAESREIAGKRSQIAREHSHRLREQAISLVSIQERIQRGELHDLLVVLKTDVGGSLEAIRDSLLKLSTDEVKVRIIHEGVGLINESDVILARASGAIVVGFHTRPDAKAHQAAMSEQVDVRLYRVIYDLVKDVKDAMSGLLAPEKIEKISGSAEVRQVFHISKVGSIAGSFVVSGTVRRGDRARVYRNADVVYDGTFSSLKRIKDDVREVTNGYECGIGLEGFEDLKEGDVIEAYTVEEVARHLD